MEEEIVCKLWTQAREDTQDEISVPQNLVLIFYKLGILISITQA